MPEYLKLLEISEENTKKTELGQELTLELPATLPWFNGHFPNQPVLPAVITTEISDALIRNFCNVAPEFVITAKFKGPIFPGTRLIISLLQPKDDSASIIWRNADEADAGQFLADLKFRL